MKASVTQILNQPWSPIRRSQKKSRSRSSQPFHFHGVLPTKSLQNSSSQPMLHAASGCHTVSRKGTMLAAPAMISLSNQLGEIKLDTQRSEKFEQNDVVLDSDGSVLSGSSEALVKRLIPSRDFCPDANYMFTLLLNIRTVMSPEELMQKIVQHCMFSQNAAADNFAREGRGRMFSHIFHLCSEWTINIPYDFRSEYMRTRLAEMLGLISVDKTYKQKATDLQYALKSTLNKLDRYEKAIKNLQRTIAETPQRVQQFDQLVGLITVCPDAKVVAQQLTHIEMERFNMVGADEIVISLANSDLADLGRNKCSPSPGSISFYIEWFNRLSSFAATEVLRQTKKRNRVDVIEFLIDVAKECCEIGNFNSLMAIVAGLSLPAVARIKRTWSRVDKAKLEILQHQLDPSGNFLSYRATMKAALWRADSAQRPEQKIIIPFFVLLLKDLFLIYHGSVRTLPNGHLNFVSFSQLSEQLRGVVRWKGANCSFPKNPSVLQYLLVSPLYGERESMLVSFECETAESSAERNQFKRLKTSAK